MPYITTNHRFIIDDKHPADVFDEMENFFSLYTVAIDDLQQVSVQLSVPANFDIKANKSIAEGYRQFTKSLKYTIPDINILPIKTHSDAHDVESDEEDSQDDNTITMLIQRLDGYEIDEEKPSLYQSVLGRLMPRFSGEKTEKGLYPEREQITIAQPVQPIVKPPVAQPQPVQQPPQPYIPPVAQPVPTPQPIVTPAVTPAEIYQPPVQPQPYQPQNPVTRPAITQQPTQPLPRLPNIAKSAKPYQDILTQVIVNEAKKLLDKTQIIQQITLKSSDSLTTAMIEQLFNSFNHAHDKTQSPHDAIDLVSYGYEVLKPQLAKIGVNLADDAGFGLKTNAKATPADIQRLQSGGVFANEINLKIKLATQQNSHQTASQNTPQNVANVSPMPTDYSNITNSNVNKNAQNIALMLKISDQLGDRQQKVSRFPLVFATRENKNTDAIRLFSANSHLQSDVFFSIVELDGNVLLDNLAPNVKVLRNGQILTAQTVLLPNDVLTIDCNEIVGTVTLGLV